MNKFLTRTSSNNPRIVALLVLLYFICFEYVLTQYLDNFGIAINALVIIIKFFFPFVIPMVGGVRSLRYILSGSRLICIFITILIFVLLSIPTISFGEPIQLIKLVPRIIFFISLILVFAEDLNSLLYLIRYLCVMLLTLFLSYLLMYIFKLYESPVEVATIRFASPGYLININSASWYSIMESPLIRFSGFFREPSNCAAFCFSIFFLSKITESPDKHCLVPRFAQLILFTSGIFCLSNAGFFSVFGAFFILNILWNNGTTSLNTVFRATKVILLAIISATWLTGRFWAGTYPEFGMYFDFIVGYDSRYEDPYGGRTVIAANIVDSVLENPLGNGLILFDDDKGSQFNSGTAPLFWLYSGGPLCLIAILGRELINMRCAYKFIGLYNMRNFLGAYLVILLQGLSYGSWMDPMYFITSASILAYAAVKRTVQ